MEPPAWPQLDATALESVGVTYDPKIDYLYVHLYGKPVPAVWDPRPDGDTWVGLRLVDDGDWADEVVGIMVAHFRSHAVQVHPRWEGALTAAGAARTQSLIGLIADVAKMPVDGEPESRPDQPEQ
jgi:hypothetical protein